MEGKEEAQERVRERKGMKKVAERKRKMQAVGRERDEGRRQVGKEEGKKDTKKIVWAVGCLARRTKLQVSWSES